MNEIETNNSDAELNARVKPSLAELSVSLIDDVKTLISKQLELFKVEVQDDLRSSGRLLLVCAVAGLIGLLALQLGVLGVVFYLSEKQGWTLYESFALAGGTLFIMSFVGAGIAVLRLKQKKMNVEAARLFKGQLKWTPKKNN